ncbi:MAG: hypothetical protein KJN69_11595 [Gammaproteobacteria bacterium]|nr:hypothetical protein [Gammaproteobacteria bacterium]
MILPGNCARLDETPYGNNWICVIEGDNLDAELPQLKIGKSAVNFIQEDLDRFKAFVQKALGDEVSDRESFFIGVIEKLDYAGWETATKDFFGR